MSRLLSRFVVAAVVATAALAPTGAADAAWIPPSQALMVNAEGRTNGCVAKVGMSFQRDGGIGGVKIVQSVTCPPDAGALRVRYNYNMYEVAKNGTLTLFVSSSPGSQGGPGTATSFFPCDRQGVGGTHTWLVRARMNTKTSVSDTNPYVGVVAVKVTLTCSV
jgi:hypothetical protein